MRPPLLAAVVLAASVPHALAQTANATPTSPAPPGLVGVPTGVDRIAPTSGERQPRGDPAGEKPRIETESPQDFHREMKQDDKESHICDRCD